jgi:alpha-amylase
MERILMKKARCNKVVIIIVLVIVGFGALTPQPLWSNPWNGKVVLQAFWWDAWNEKYPQDWYTYLAKLAPRLRELGIDGIWIPSPAKGNVGASSMGYDIFDHYDLGDKGQKGTVATRFGNKDSLLRLIAVAHANELGVYPDIVLNHVIGGAEDPQAPRQVISSRNSAMSGFQGPIVGAGPRITGIFTPIQTINVLGGTSASNSLAPTSAT